MKRISLKGVLIGNVTDVVSAHVVLVPLMIYITISAPDFLPRLFPPAKS